MNNTREKLIEVLQTSPMDIMGNHPVGSLADWLIVNGVTFATDNNVGHWIEDKRTGFCYCSECLVNGSPQWKRCPVCEAKMEGV